MLNFPNQEKRMSLTHPNTFLYPPMEIYIFSHKHHLYKKKMFRFRPENFVAILTAILVHFFCLLNHSWYKEMGLVCCLFGYIHKNIYTAYTQNTS